LQRAFCSHVDPPSKSSSSSRQEFSPSDSTTTPMLFDHPRIPSKSSSFPDDQLSDHPSESSSSAFSATSASDFNHRALLSAVERLHPALDELRAWQTNCVQPVASVSRVHAHSSGIASRGYRTRRGKARYPATAVAKGQNYTQISSTM
jgi:hypothetical protein